MRRPSKPSGINRRNALNALIVAAGAAPFLPTMTRVAHAGAKIPQSAVHYQPAPKNGQDCDDCANFVSPSGCKLVDGDISPKGWCRLWSKKAA
jgi:hypothetical protein